MILAIHIYIYYHTIFKKKWKGSYGFGTPSCSLNTLGYLGRDVRFFHKGWFLDWDGLLGLDSAMKLRVPLTPVPLMAWLGLE